MYQKKINFAGKEITVTAGRETISGILHHITAPLDIQQSTENDSGIMTALFSDPVWSWEDFPAELKADYDRELTEYAAKIPNNVTVRTVLPLNSWMYKYIPLQSTLEKMKEDRKTPEERQREADEAQRRQREAARYKEEREQTVNALILAQVEARARYPFLMEGSSAADASKNLKILLSRLWPATKFSVVSDTFSMGDSINVRWTDGPTVDQVEGYANQFQSGYVNTMEDMTEHVSKGMHVFGDAKYVSCNRSISDALSDTVFPAVQAAIAAIDIEGGAGKIAGTKAGIYCVKCDREYYVETEGDTRPRRYRSDLEDAAWYIARDIVGAAEVPETDLNKQPETARRAASPVASAAPITVEGVTISRNTEKNGIEVQFSEKPEESILVFLKSNGFRWSKFAKLWYARYSETLMEDVKSRVLSVAA
jgi:hypothetical protein